MSGVGEGKHKRVVGGVRGCKKGVMSVRAHMTQRAPLLSRPKQE